MLHSLNNLQDYAIRAVDGTVGHVVDLYFDDQTWIVRYFVVETGSFTGSKSKQTAGANKSAASSHSAGSTYAIDPLHLSGPALRHQTVCPGAQTRRAHASG